MPPPCATPRPNRAEPSRRPSVARVAPSSTGARKSLRTSTRGHSATQKVACDHAIDLDRGPALLHRHRPRDRPRASRIPADAAWRLVAPEHAMRQSVGPEHGVDLHLGIAELADQRTELAGQCSAPDLDRPGHPHLNRPARGRGAHRRASRCPRGATRTTRVHAAAGTRVAGAGQEVPHPAPVVGKGGRDPLDTMDRRALSGQRSQHRRPGSDPAVLLVCARGGRNCGRAPPAPP